MLQQALAPPPMHKRELAPDFPEMRAADMEDIVSLPVKDLFKDIQEEIYRSGDELSIIRQATKEALKNVDMSMIKPDDSVNLLCSEHGFALMGGHAYAEMLIAIKDVVLQKTDCKNPRLCFAVGGGLVEARTMIPHYGLDKHFDRIKMTHPLDKGVAIETDIGALYGLKQVYDADWIIHTCYSDPREIYFHREINRILKTFTMAYARFETRSAYHMNFSSRSSNVIPRAIFDSDFVQDKFAFVCVLETSPAGVTNVIADTDFYRVDRTVTKNSLKSYGKLIRLLGEIDECVVVLDGMRWAWYVHGGGLVAGTLFMAPHDYLNLDMPGREPGSPELNPAVKALVVNHVWPELMFPLVLVYPTFVVGDELAGMMPRFFPEVGTVSDDLKTAVKLARERAGTDKILVFDGCYGRFNLSPSMGEYLLKIAPEIRRQVDEELLPLWLSQRGLAA